MGLWQNFQNETVGTLNLREPVLAGPGDSLDDAIQKMRKAKLGCVIVVEDNKPVGMFTENKLTTLIFERGSAVAKDTLRDHMTTPCPSVKKSDPIARVLAAMQAENVRFLCVVGDDGQIVGLTGQKGLMEFVADHFPNQVMVQRIDADIPSEREGA